MKLFKKWSSIFAIVLCVTFLLPEVTPINNAVVTQAATIKISQKTLTLQVGKSKTLKITGTKKKVTWSSSKKSVAVVDSKGKVTGKKAGTAVITAKVNNKKYTCKVTVKKADTKKEKNNTVDNSFIKNAPFEAQETIHGKLKFIIPKTWKQTTAIEQNGAAMLMYTPASYDQAKGTSNIILTYEETGKEKFDYEVIKEILQEYITADLITSQLAQQGITATVSDFKTSDVDTKLGKAFKVDYTVKVGDSVFTQTIYEIYIDNYNFEITITDMQDEVTPDIYTISNYLIDTLTVTK